MAIIGGAKISDKISVITSLTRLVDSLLIGGGMANTFLLAMGHKVGDSLAEPDAVEEVNKILFFAQGPETEMHLPIDVVIADAMDANANRKVVTIDQVPDGWRILDIGPETVADLAEEIKEPGRCSGTGRWAISRPRRSPKAPARSPRRWPRAARKR